LVGPQDLRARLVLRSADRKKLLALNSYAKPRIFHELSHFTL